MHLLARTFAGSSRRRGMVALHQTVPHLNAFARFALFMGSGMFRSFCRFYLRHGRFRSGVDSPRHFNPMPTKRFHEAKPVVAAALWLNPLESLFQRRLLCFRTSLASFLFL